jgi:hypothetical protein
MLNFITCKMQYMEEHCKKRLSIFGGPSRCMSSILYFTSIPDRWVFTHVSDPDLVPIGKHRVWSFPVSGFCSIQDDKELQPETSYELHGMVNYTYRILREEQQCAALSGS